MSLDIGSRGNLEFLTPLRKNFNNLHNLKKIEICEGSQFGNKINGKKEPTRPEPNQIKRN